MTAKLIPKDVPVDQWKQLKPNRIYGIRATVDDDIYLRFGLGGLFVSILKSTPETRMVHTLGHEDGAPTVVGKLVNGELAIMGRGADCAIKVSHPVMSRQHVELHLDGNVLMVKDVGSTNGTSFYAENIVFDIEEYIESHPLDKASESTMDALHEAFGSSLNDFLNRYQNKKLNP